MQRSTNQNLFWFKTDWLTQKTGHLFLDLNAFENIYANLKLNIVNKII